MIAEKRKLFFSFLPYQVVMIHKSSMTDTK